MDAGVGDAEIGEDMVGELAAPVYMDPSQQVCSLMYRNQYSIVVSLVIICVV